jgi:hypothetical protein
VVVFMGLASIALIAVLLMIALRLWHRAPDRLGGKK